MANKVVQLVDENNDNLYPLSSDPNAAHITMTTTDPGEGAALGQNEFVAVYGGSTKVGTSDIVDGAVTSQKIDWTTITTVGKITANGLSPTEDTTSAWRALFDNKNGEYTTYYSTANVFTNQPSPVGFLKTFIDGANVFQLWFRHRPGPIFYRGGNSDGWSPSSGVFTSVTNGRYDTAEKEAGVWIDGRTIYRKTIEWGAMPNAARVNKTGQFPNNATIINIEAIAMSSTAAHNMPYVYSGGSGGDHEEAVFVSNTTNGQLSVSTTTDRSSWNAYITLYYCKASS